MKPRIEPRITYSPLTGSWFLLTRYRTVTGIDATGEKKRYLRALEKHDITDQMVTIIREVERRTLARKRGRELVGAWVETSGNVVGKSRAGNTRGR